VPDEELDDHGNSHLLESCPVAGPEEELPVRTWKANTLRDWHGSLPTLEQVLARQAPRPAALRLVIDERNANLWDWEFLECTAKWGSAPGYAMKSRRNGDFF
jgi:hypothetical protein